MTAIPVGCPAKLEMNFNWSDLVVGLAWPGRSREDLVVACAKVRVSLVCV